MTERNRTHKTRQAAARARGDAEVLRLDRKPLLPPLLLASPDERGRPEPSEEPSVEPRATRESHVQSRVRAPMLPPLAAPSAADEGRNDDEDDEEASPKKESRR